MRRKLDYSAHEVPANRRVDIGSLPQGGWHVSKTGGKLRGRHQLEMLRQIGRDDG